MTKVLTINGNAINDIPSFYDEINRVFMGDEDWKIGQSLDALDDLLYGGFGAIEGKEKIVLIWQNMEKNREDLGLAATYAFYQAKLEQPEIFNVAFIRQKLAELDAKGGPTYFDIVQEIIASHNNIELRSDDKSSAIPED